MKGENVLTQGTVWPKPDGQTRAWSGWKTLSPSEPKSTVHGGRGSGGHGDDR